MERGNIHNNAMFQFNTNNYNQTIERTVLGQVSRLGARGHWNGNKCWDQNIENIGEEEEERWGTNCDPPEIDDGWVSW